MKSFDLIKLKQVLQRAGKQLIELTQGKPESHFNSGKDIQLLNLGCGARFHQDWTNIDLFSRHPKVLSHNLKYPLPFPNESFDAVYHSHVLEHLPRHQAAPFVKECFRVLKHDGIIRVVVPNL